MSRSEAREVLAIMLPAVGLVAVETLLIQQYWPSLCAILWALIRLVRGRGRPQALAIAAAGVVAIASNVVLAKRAGRQALVVIAAVERHRVERGAYPQALSELVPAYLVSVPRAKPGVFGAFDYLALPHDDALLVWVILPPFGRRTYAFGQHRPGSID